MSTDAIQAIQNSFATMNETQKTTLLKEFGIKDIASINLIRPELAEKYCKSHNINLGEVSTWSTYNKGQAEYAKAYQQYTQAETIFAGFKNQKIQAQQKYQTLVNNYQSSNGNADISGTEKDSLARKAGYTTDLIRNTSDAEMSVDLALDARRQAVNTQRRGLSEGIMFNA